jgi:colicin import membrane protein
MLMSGSNEERYGLNLMIFLSLVFHVLVLSLLFFSAPRSSPRWTFGPVYSVQLVSSADVSSGAGSSSVPHREMRTALPKDLTAVAKSLPGRMSLPLEKTVPGKGQKDEVEKAIEHIRETVRTAKPAAPSAAKGAQGTAPPAGGSRTGAGEGKGRINAYYALVWSMVKAQWALPGAMLPPGNIETVVHVRILRSGAVTELGFEKRSGNRYLDESAMKAIQKASPFPPLPEGTGLGDSIELGIRFHSSELR